MSTRSNFVYLAAAGFVLAVLPIWAKTPHKQIPEKAPESSVTIENTGSTNTTGYQIVVSSGGSASYREVSKLGASPQGLPRVQTMPAELTKKLFTDLAAAGPLASLPVRHGMRSVSFGTATYLTYKGQSSPDLTFPANPQAQALRDDVMAIAQAMHAANNARRPFNYRPLP